LASSPSPSFAILCVGRVGSEHLVSLLDSHPDVTCFSELFAPDWAVEPQHGTLTVPHYVSTSHERPASYWRELASGLKSPVAGLKLPWSSIEAHKDALELLEDPAVDIIRLTRRDRVAQYVSAWLALESGVWHSTQGAYREGRIEVDPDKCRHALERISRQEDRLDRIARGHRVFKLTYEDLVAGHGLDDLQAFLGVQPRELTSMYERLRDRPLRDVIENFDELAAALAETPFAMDRGAT
jgi:LPS sulfotransferase NodH